MRAAVMVAPGRIEVREVERPRPTREGDVLIRTELSTVCGSDVHIVFHEWTPTMDRNPGFPCHETVGTVVESRSAAVRTGQRVLGVPNLEHAAGFAEYQVLPDRFVIPIPYDDVATERIVFAQQLGTAIYAMKRFWAGSPARTAVVLGAGPAGLCFTALCRIAGFQDIVVSDLHAHRLASARDLGATRTVRADESVVAAVGEVTEGRGAELVVEAAGNDVTRLQAFECVAEEGMVGLFGIPDEDHLTLPFREIFRRKPTITMQSNAQAEPGHTSFRTAIDLIASGRVDTAPFQLMTVGIDGVPDLLRTASDPRAGFVKGGVVFP